MMPSYDEHLFAHLLLFLVQLAKTCAFPIRAGMEARAL